MDKQLQLAKEIEIEAKVCKNLAQLAEERGVTTFLDVEIDEIVNGEFDETPDAILKRLKKTHRHIHEALYAPPTK